MVDASAVLRQGLLQLSKSGQVRTLVEKAPVSRDVVRRFVPGERTADAVGRRGRARRAPAGSSPSTTSARTPPTSPRRAPPATPTSRCSTALSEAGLTQGGRAEVSVKLSALGQALPGDGHKIALDHAREICQAADATPARR